MACQFPWSSPAPLTSCRLNLGGSSPPGPRADLPFPTHRNLPDPQGPADVAGKVMTQAGPGCPHRTEVSGQQAQQALAFLRPFTRPGLC